jgi:hypothetical protein
MGYRAFIINNIKFKLRCQPYSIGCRWSFRHSQLAPNLYRLAPIKKTLGAVGVKVEENSYQEIDSYGY